MSGDQIKAVGFLGRISGFSFLAVCIFSGLVGSLLALVIAVFVDAAISPGSKNVPSYLYIALLFGFCGPIVGMIIKRRTARSEQHVARSEPGRSEVVSPTPQNRGWLRTGAISAGVLLLLVIALIGMDDGITELPECDSPTAKSHLKSAIENSPTNRGRVEIFSVKNVKECGVREDGSQQLIGRACSGTLFTNAGELPTNFLMRWIDKSKGEWFLQTGICPAIGFDSWISTPTKKARSANRN
jgi:uncharacterized membrane protein YhaH (DUF805 family)